MTSVSKMNCRMRLSDVPTPTPAVVRREISCDLWIDGRDEKLTIAGTLIRNLTGSMIVDSIQQDDFNIGPVEAAELLRALYKDSGLGDDGGVRSRSVMDFEVTDNEGGILERVACDLHDTVWS